MIKYVVIDRHTGEQVGKPYTSKNRARCRAEKLDMQYGAYRYIIKPIELA